MSSRRTRRLLLRAASTDRTFRRQRLDGHVCLVGKCIHCRTAIYVPVSPTVAATATLEHIVPRSHGGTDDAANLTLACAPCNAGKGTRLDHRPTDDPTLTRVVDRLRRRREERLRPPIDLPDVSS